MQINGRAKLMIAGLILIVVAALILFYGVDNFLALMQNNVIDLLVGICIGAIFVYLLLHNAQELTTPMTAKETFTRFCWACKEELELPLIEGQVMFNLVGATLIQKGKLLAYRGRLYLGMNDYTTWTLLIDATIRDPSRLKSPLVYRTPRFMTDKEILKLIDELSAPTGPTQGKEAVIETLKEAQKVKSAIKEEEEG